VKTLDSARLDRVRLGLRSAGCHAQWYHSQDFRLTTLNNSRVDITERRS
jgi:hypothetical protein